jgi:opacity protein-like surface antigen
MIKVSVIIGFLLLCFNVNCWGQAKQNKDNAEKAYQFKRDGNIQFSAGYGFPSLLRFITKLEFMLNVFETKGVGPVHGKVEYVYKNKFSIGASGFYNSFYTRYRRYADTLHYVLRDISVQGRANYYIRNNEKYQFYVGAGLGSVNFKNKTYSVITINNIQDTVLQTTLLKDFDKTTMEAGIGYRYWVRPHLGAYAELGIGRTILTFLDRGAADSFIQVGISGRIFGRRKK